MIREEGKKRAENLKLSPVSPVRSPVRSPVYRSPVVPALPASRPTSRQREAAIRRAERELEAAGEPEGGDH